ncbi:hypothetical protein L873DRAFT_1789008 [Choiromyces venosus 120613-1]|uniref:C2H2-type domain-containing protein n=1 Tax=Choiromyces venosus 120613-1 TaxID=1336337 RepID=A0A3N4IYF7_9PEZI|nr:hypothetical protein L873DRAFT_1795744 [Choiromyces venosus 120613-1]RPB00430.1 hypothetical protein L873DRAFT_1789008 [Choiromyces venosus 120613-1]
MDLSVRGYSHSTLDLILTDATGKALPLNPELGPLPLYLQDDGWCTVLGPPLSHITVGVNRDNHSTNNIPTVNNVGIPAPIIAPRDKVYCGSSRCVGNSGPHTCSSRSFTCDAPDCARATPFPTRQALNRHYEMIHLDERLDCPVPGCQNIGERGIKRYDNLVVHVRSKHGMTIVSGSQGD